MNGNYLLTIWNLLESGDFSQLEVMLNSDYVEFNKGALYNVVRHEELFANAMRFICEDPADLRRIILFANLSNVSDESDASLTAYNQTSLKICAVKVFRAVEPKVLIEAFFDLHLNDDKKIKTMVNKLVKNYKLFNMSDAFEVFEAKNRKAETVKIIYSFCKLARWENVEDSTVLMSRLSKSEGFSGLVAGQKREADALLAKYGLMMISRTTNFNGAFPSLFDNGWRESAKMVMQAVENGDIPRHLFASNALDKLEEAMRPKRVRSFLLKHNLID